jgi:hypothetical protein
MSSKILKAGPISLFSRIFVGSHQILELNLRDSALVLLPIQIEISAKYLCMSVDFSPCLSAQTHSGAI